MISVAENLREAIGQAEHKAHDLARPGRYAVSAMLAELVAGKEALGGGRLFWRAVLCNMLVCLGIWMFQRARGDGVKVFVLWLPVLVFVAVAFEHCVANMALYSLAILDGTAGFGDLGRSPFFTVPGDIVGGGALVACAYWFTGRPDPVPGRASGALIRPMNDRFRRSGKPCLSDARHRPPGWCGLSVRD
ncbi:formate/nitrite transporter family protein [Streptomyces sp. NPDC001728]|uniref:formate/nitrite transporter family protein n=1 Tax=Streptomyces sp. NPDC001728 TaxID=3154396 RepID=UPI003330C2A4